MCGFNNKLLFLVEVVVPANSTQQRIQFTDQPYLRNKAMFSLETYTVHDMALSPQGNALPSVAQMGSAYVTFYTSDPDNPTNQGEWIQLLPMWNLHNLQNTQNDTFEREKFLLSGQTIIWEKSYLTLSAPLGSTSNVSFLFNVGFSFKSVIPNQA